MSRGSSPSEAASSIRSRWCPGSPAPRRRSRSSTRSASGPTSRWARRFTSRSPAARLQEIVDRGTGVVSWFEDDRHAGDILVAFEAKAVRVEAKENLGAWIVEGVARYPAKPRLPAEVRVDIDGFELVITDLTATPKGTTGSVVVRLPACMTDPATCDRVTLDLGTVPLTAGCELSVDAAGQAYGPWLVGDTGLAIEGTGYVLDLSTTSSPSGRPAGWRGMELGSGTATGAGSVPDPSNTGYLRGAYAHGGATVTGAGLDAVFILDAPVRFTAIEPRGHVLTLDSGWLGVSHCEITGGEFGPGTVVLPTDAVCAGAVGAPVDVRITAVSVQPDLDLAGVLDAGGATIDWGELTNHGDELIAWQASVVEGYLYLNAGPRPSWCPEAGGAFAGPVVSLTVDATLAELEATGASGVTFPRLDEGAPVLAGRAGWRSRAPSGCPTSRAGSVSAISGSTPSSSPTTELRNQKLGEPARTGYVGVDPFRVDLFGNDKQNLARPVRHERGLRLELQRND